MSKSKMNSFSITGEMWDLLLQIKVYFSMHLNDKRNRNITNISSGNVSPMSVTNILTNVEFAIFQLYFMCCY